MCRGRPVLLGLSLGVIRFFKGNVNPIVFAAIQVFGKLKAQKGNTSLSDSLPLGPSSDNLPRSMPSQGVRQPLSSFATLANGGLVLRRACDVSRSYEFRMHRGRAALKGWSLESFATSQIAAGACDTDRLKKLSFLNEKMKMKWRPASDCFTSEKCEGEEGSLQRRRR